LLTDRWKETTPIPSRLRLNDALRGAGVHPEFQPIVDLSRGVVAGYEALARFDTGPSDPQVWFAAARERGCEDRLEAALLRLSLQHREQLPPNTFLSVNVSPPTLASEAVRNVFREQGDLGGVVVELTDQSPVGSQAELEPMLNSLRSAGAAIAVDDAGAGYAGLRHVLGLRPSIIKLDRDLVSDIDIDETKRALAEMLGTFASRIDASLLAEGVERFGELDALAGLGIPLAQGYLLGTAGPPWVRLHTEVSMRLATRSSTPSDRQTLRDHLVTAPSVRDASGAGLLFRHRGIEAVVVIDEYDRPVGFLDADVNSMGVLRPGMRANVDTPVAEVAVRAITRDRVDRFAPILCTDIDGRYVGIVPMERIVTALAACTDG
jgi:EAL domain-containing protein (putative c-di-GMP-specific phosphodiesterase class I)